MYLDKARMKLLGLLEKESVVDESLKEKQSCNICLKLESHFNEIQWIYLIVHFRLKATILKMLKMIVPCDCSGS